MKLKQKEEDAKRKAQEKENKARRKKEQKNRRKREKEDTTILVQPSDDDRGQHDSVLLIQ